MIERPTEKPLARALAIALGRLHPVGDAPIEALAAVSARRSFEAGSWLLRAGERAEQCFLVTRGLVRELYVGENGEEHTRTFISDGQMTGSLLDLLSNEPSVTWIQALAPTTTFTFRYRDLDALSARFPELHVVARRHAEALYVQKSRREHDLLALSATERHARWLAQNPGLDARVSRRHLASYLGVTPEHLSRLRRAAR